MLTLLASMSTGLAADDPLTFEHAIERMQARDYPEAVREMQVLAERGDARAQYGLGVAYLEGKWLPRDVPHGLAWLQIAAEGYTGSYGGGAADDARRVLEQMTPRATGADLIRADQIAGAFVQTRNRELAAKTGVAIERIRAAVPLAEGFLPSEPDIAGVNAGCAVAPPTGDCSRKEMPNSPAERCRGGSGATTPSMRRLRLQERPATRYPTDARRMAWEGIVSMLAYVDQGGWVCAVVLVQGSGIDSLDREALRIAQRARFVPNTAAGQAVETFTGVQVAFGLRDYSMR